ncbi:Phosphoglucomutase-3 [Arachnomyces sp. PD_36]|nr:Phosphoglucomutase-3 [Arachnomyces sp. PD_36]
MSPNTSASETLPDLVQKWLEWDKDPETSKEIEKLREANDTNELEKRLCKRIQFGTAGLRGRMAAGFSRMNCLTVIQTSQGLAKYLKEDHGPASEKGVVIGYDARHNSSKYAALAANAFVAQGIPVWVYPSCAPTPLVPYGVLFQKAVAGIMVTASHNPPQDNGYKLYFTNGAQINSPTDVQIAERIEHNLEPWPTAWDPLGANGFMETGVFNDLRESYCNAVCNFATSTTPESIKPRPFVYTPLHGVGSLLMPDLCAKMGIDEMMPVKQQEAPDPDFPTVKFPNPEESGALDLAMETGDKLNQDLILANDPDADRFAVVEKVNGSWYRFTGDQIGMLFASHILDMMNSRKDDKRFAMLASAVSSNILEKMAKAEGFHFEETLTGFKWLGNIARNLEDKGYSVPFAFEEALGYMFPDVCYDKDGLAGAMVFLAAESKWRSQGLSPYSKLQQLFETYGYHETLNTYFVSPDSGITMELFKSIRNRAPEKKNELGTFAIQRLRDMTEEYDSGTTGNKPALPIDPSSQMLTLWLDRGVRFTLRASGTEPKVKIYIESCRDSREDAAKTVCDVFLAVLKDWIEPYAPSLTYSPKLVSSSGFVFNVA